VVVNEPPRTEQTEPQPTNLTNEQPPVVIQNQEIPPAQRPRTEQTRQTSVPLPEVSDRSGADLSFTLITRQDRFPTRIPQTKRLTPATPQNNQNIIVPPPEPILIEEVIPEPEPIRQDPIHQIMEESEIPREIIARTISSRSDLSDIEELVLSYYNLASVDSILVAYLIGASANIIGDYRNAIDYLSSIPSSFSRYNEVLRLLHDSYLNLGDITNANYYQSLMLDDHRHTEFSPLSLKMWMVISLCILMLIGGFVGGYFLLKLRKKTEYVEEEIDDEALEVHTTNLQRAYETKEIVKEEPIANFDDDDEDDFYVNPPIITEDLSKEEDEELAKEENPPPAEVNQEKEEADLDPYSDEEYRKKMILKLFSDGWKNEEIAKELQISHREIQFIIKMNT
jgi:hypothetical protein